MNGVGCASNLNSGGLAAGEDGVEGGVADEIGNALETQIGGGVGEQQLLLGGQSDVHLLGAPFCRCRLRGPLAALDHRRDRDRQSVLGCQVALLGRLGIGKYRGKLDGGADETQSVIALEYDAIVGGDLLCFAQDGLLERLFESLRFRPALRGIL